MASTFNPFLTEDTSVPTKTSGFNPFLSDTDYAETTNTSSENPFLTSYPVSSNTNPFAFASNEPESANAQQFFSTAYDSHSDPPVPEANFFAQEPAVNNIFANFQEPAPPPVEHVHESTVDFFSQDDLLSSHDTHLVDLHITNDISPPFGTPKRPPPPRPPPSKETKDLILSVTGAMEATSSDLLDRLQAIRTPSPTLIRDLHSPSPTPDAQVQNLLGSDDITNIPNFFDQQTPQNNFSDVKSENLLGDTDLLSNPLDIGLLGEEAPIMELNSQQENFITQQTDLFSTPAPVPTKPQKPPPPVRPERPRIEPSINIFKNEDQVPSVFEVDKVSNVTGEAGQSAENSVEVSITNEIPTDSSLRKASIGSSQPTSRKTSKDFASNDVFNSVVNSRKSSQGNASVESSKIHSTAGSRKPSQTSMNDFTPVSSEPIQASFESIQSAPTRLEQEQPFAPVASTFESETPFAAAHIGFGDSEPSNVDPFTTQQTEIGQQSGTTPFGFEKDPSFTAANVERNNFEPNYVDPFNAPQTELENDVFAAPVSYEEEKGQEYSSLNFTSEPQAPLYADDSKAFTSQINSTSPFSQDTFITSETKPAQLSASDAFSIPPVKQDDEFDAFAAKFDSVTAKAAVSDPFAATNAFGDNNVSAQEGDVGFGTEDTFDAFLALQEPPPVPQSTPARVRKGDSPDSDDGGDEFNVFIKPKTLDADSQQYDGGVVPSLAPPPKSPQGTNAFQDTSPRFNPFDKSQEFAAPAAENVFPHPIEIEGKGEGMRAVERTDSQETPPTPLFDDDVSQPLEEFPRIHYTGPGWEMQLRQPNKKKITGQRFWKKIWIRLVYQADNPVLQLLNKPDDKDPFQDLLLLPCYSVSDIGAQQFDNFGKIFTVKVQYIFYKERPGIRPGQQTKAERLSNRLSQFAAYAIQGDYQGCKEFGSDLKKLGLPVEHAPHSSQLFKLGSHNYEDMKQFCSAIEEALFKLPAPRDRAMNYKMEEVQITAVDEIYVEQDEIGIVQKQIARVRIFFLGFLSGMPDVEVGVNDLVRQGKEVVGRHDIIPVVTEEWIRLEAVEFHNCVQQDNYEVNKTIRFKPPDACYIELMRFRVRPPRNRELPLQLKTTMCITGNKVELRAEVLVPGFTSRKLGQIPCEDVMVRFPIPECWIYLFRVEKHFRYGSVKSAHRRTGKVKGIERFLGAVDNLEPQLMEVTSGQAKYEHQHRSIVWRMPRLPKEGQGAYTTHSFVCRMNLTSYDQIPEELSKYSYVEFTMPTTQVSHTTVRSVSIHNSDSDNPPEKYVRQLARHEYRVGIEFTQGEGPNEYVAATRKRPEPIVEQPVQPAPAAADSDSDSSG